MQRKRSASNAFPEQIDLNQAAFNNTSMDNPASEDHTQNPVINYILVSSDEDVNRPNNANNGESSSNSNNPQNGYDSKMTGGRSSSLNASSGPYARSLDWSFQPSNMNSCMQNYSLNSVHGDNIGTLSGTFLDNNDASNPSFGSSCKRKAVEGTSGQFYPGGSSSSNQPTGTTLIQDPILNSYAPHGNLNLSSGQLNLSPNYLSEQLNLNSGVGMNTTARPLYPSPHVPVIAENSARNFTIRSNPMRNFSVYASQQGLEPISNNNDSSELRVQLTFPTNPTNTVSQSHIMHVNEANPYPWSGSLGSRGRSSSSSFTEDNVRSSRRNNLEYPMTVSEEQTDWAVSGSRAEPSSGLRAMSVRNQTSQTHQRLWEAAASIPHPRMESDSVTRRRPFALIASNSSSSRGVAETSGAQNQSDQRPAAFLIEMDGDDVTRQRSLADLEGRHRLIRQLLNAMRRGVRLRDEDYALLDPLLDEFAELHDRHRDMRLDVDNMSYEELLALGEQIGEVSTGLSEDKIKGFMKQTKYEGIGISTNLEPCCICREDYISGDNIGILDCKHEFHASCIEQWLILKNLYPICKTTALGTRK